MSAGDSNFSAEHVLGNVSVLRYINPQVRASIRREDPDGNPEPHYTGLNGTTLNIDYSPTGAVALNFTSDNLDDVLTLINGADPVNLIGIEEDGYLVLKNLNGGGKNYIEIISGDAAPILGFVVSPEPGSKSFAGELATSPPGRYKSQNNPQGTGLIAGDEDLTSASLNRALARSIVGAARVARDLDILVPAVQEFSGVVATHAGSGKQVVYIQDADLRIPVNGFGITGTTQAARELDAVVHILTPDDEPLIDIDQVTERYARVLDIYSEGPGTGSPSLNNGLSVSSFGTPDGKSIFGPTVEDLDIQGVTAISQIRGDLIVAAGALFITAGVQPGNTAVVEGATNNDPFNHNGEFIVTEVLTETILAVRPKTEFETTFITSEKPTTINKNLPGGSSYGTVRVVVGDYFSAKDGVAFELPSWVAAATNVKIRCVSGARMRNVGLGDFTRALSPNQGSLLKEFKDHIVDAVVGRRHGAADVDAPAVVGSPDSLTVGTVEDQLAELLNHVNNLIAGQVSYAGGVNWADGTANPPTDLESQVDKILTDLATGAGTAKLLSTAGPAWADGTTNPSERLDERLDSIITDLATGAGAAKVAVAVGSAWLDGTLNPAERLDQRVDSIITDLTTNGGGAKVGLPAGPNWHSDSGLTTPAESVQGRLDRIVTDLASETSGASMIGAPSTTNLPAGSVSDQLDQLEGKAYDARVLDIALNAGVSFELQNDGAAGGGWVNDDSVIPDLLTWKQQQHATLLGNVLSFDLPIPSSASDVISAITAIGVSTSATVVLQLWMFPFNVADPRGSRVSLGSVTGPLGKYFGSPLPLQLTPAVHTYNFALNRYVIQLYSTTGAGQNSLHKLAVTYRP